MLLGKIENLHIKLGCPKLKYPQNNGKFYALSTQNKSNIKLILTFCLLAFVETGVEKYE
jgi:hypothetical protein